MPKRYPSEFRRRVLELLASGGTVAEVAAMTVARRLAEATWWMLTRNQPFAPAGATQALAA